MSEPFPSIPVPVGSLDSHQRVLLAVKELLEVLAGQRGTDRAARLSDLLGLPTASGTDLTYDAALRTVLSSTGSDAALPLVTAALAGLAPASGGGTSNFLRADGTWAAPAGGVAEAPINGQPYVRRDAAWNVLAQDLGRDVLAYDFGSGAPTASQQLSLVMVHDVSIPNNFTGSRGSVLVNPASSLVVTVAVGGVSLGTATVSTGGAVTWAFNTPGSPFAVSAGTRVTMTMPGTIPGSVAGFAASIMANRTT